MPHDSATVSGLLQGPVYTGTTFAALLTNSAQDLRKEGLFRICGRKTDILELKMALESGMCWRTVLDCASHRLCVVSLLLIRELYRRADAGGRESICRGGTAQPIFTVSPRASPDL